MRSALVLATLLCSALFAYAQENRLKVTRPKDIDPTSTRPASAPALSQPSPSRLKLVQPPSSALTLTKLGSGPDLAATFRGELRVSGTLMGIWRDGATASSSTSPEYVLVLDKESSATTPHFVSHQPPQSIRYAVRSLTITNGPAALIDLAGSDRVERLNQRRVNHVRVTGQFVLDGLVVGVECNMAWARARFVGSEVAQRSIVSQPFIPPHC